MKMSDYYPDRWAIVHITSKDHPPIDKVVGSFYGNFTGGDSWRMNSGIERVVETENVYEVHGYSGSVYYCKKGCQGMSAYTEMVMNNLATLLEEDGLGMMRVIDIKELL